MSINKKTYVGWYAVCEMGSFWDFMDDCKESTYIDENFTVAHVEKKGITYIIPNVETDGCHFLDEFESEEIVIADQNFYNMPIIFDKLNMELVEQDVSFYIKYGILTWWS